MSNKVTRLVFILAVLLAAVQVAQAQLITAVAHRNTDTDATEAPQIASSPLAEGSLTFVDRTHVYADVPELVLGAEYILLANDNKNNSAYELDITLAGNAIVYVFVDNRMGGAAGGLGVAPIITGMPWLTDMGFVDTDIDIGIDESADGSINQYYSIFALEVKAGVVTIGGDTEGHGGNMLGVAVMPAPTSETATNPVPGAGATDIPREVTLAWNPGEGATSHDVYFGTVYADVEAASRANPMGVLVSQGQTDTDYVLGRLEFGQTYYWRVDALQGATVFKGDVWSFTVEPFAYAVEGVVATTNAVSTAGQGPENTVNGSGLNENDGHSIESMMMWTATFDPNLAAYIQFDFDRVYKMHEMVVWNHNLSFEFLLGIGLKEVTIEYSSDGTEWTVLGDDVVLAQAPGNTSYTGSPVSLQGVPAKAIRLMIKSTYGTSGQMGLSEVRFLYIPAHPREPKPDDGAADVEVTTALSWRAGRDAASHVIYLGEDPNALDIAATTTVSSLTPSNLNYGTTYAWQVVEVNEAEPVTAWDGDIWTFSTQEFQGVDDFESYTDDVDAGQAIWQTWIDGLDDATHGGGIVGYDQSPFCEQTTVHGGGQAMPFRFSTSLSEADRNFSPGQNWKARGLKGLSLWFYGAEGNTGQLYVKINGTKVSYPGNQDDIAKAAWQPFNVDLSTIASAGNVTQMTIGVSGAGANQGTLFIDDIRLYPKTPELIYPVEPAMTELLAQYKFEGNANDSSGHGLNGTLVSAQTVAGGQSGMGLQVDDGGYMDLGNPAALDFATEDWAMTVWYKTAMVGTGDANKGCIVGKGGDSTGGHRYCLIMSETTEGVLSLITDDDVTKYVVNSTSVTNDDEWHSAVGQRAGTSLEIYIDGVLEASATATEAYNLSGTVQHNAYVGVITNHADGTRYKTYQGLVDDVRIYHQALTEGEILWLSGETMPKPKPF